jgi:PmbA protein
MISAVDLVQEVVKRARRAGADEAEAFFEEYQTTRLELREQQVESLTSAARRGLGLRVVFGGGSSYVYTTDLRPRSLLESARQAVALAREATPDPHRGLPTTSSAPSGGDLKIYDPALAEVTVDQKIDLLKEIERLARAEDGRIRGTETARYSDAFGAVALANSHGLAASYQRSSTQLALQVIARQDGEALRGYGFSVGHGFEDLSPRMAAQQAASRALKPLGGRPVPTQTASVVMEPEVAAELLGQIAQALSAEAMLKGRSMFAAQLGQQVGSELVTLMDEGGLPAGLATAPFDDEGVAGSRTLLMERGTLRGFLHNTYTARRAGLSSTGNGVRPSFRLPPEVAPTNFSLAGQTVSRQQLLADMDRGMLVVTTRNVGGINPVNGDYSVGAAGVWIEHGQEVGPVAGVTIAANMHDMLAGLVAIGDDFRWTPGSAAFGCGSIRIEGMTIAGA